MPKKKTGQRKKAEKQKVRQKGIRAALKSLADQPCNASMVRQVICVSQGEHSLFDISNICRASTR